MEKEQSQYHKNESAYVLDRFEKITIACALQFKIEALQNDIKKIDNNRFNDGQSFYLDAKRYASAEIDSLVKIRMELLKAADSIYQSGDRVRAINGPYDRRSGKFSGGAFSINSFDKAYVEFDRLPKERKTVVALVKLTDIRHER